MNLTADTFVQIVQSLKSGPVAGHEHRAMPRVGVSGRALVMVPGKFAGKLFQGTVRDLSANGIGLLLAEGLVGKGDQFLLVLPEGTEQGRRAVEYVVRRVAKTTGNVQLVGAEFVREVLMDRAAKPAAAAV